jgi:hypothetical protein
MRGVASSKDKKNPKYFLDNKLIIDSIDSIDSINSNFSGNFNIKDTLNNII